MRGRIEEMRERFIEPLLSRSPRLLPTKPDAAARYALYSAIAWFVLWMLMAAVVAIKLVFPKLLHQFPWMSYGRLRPAETNILMWGVLFNGAMGAAFAIIPRVCGVKLWSERIAAQLVMFVDTIVLAGTLLLLVGRTEGIEGFEWPWPVAIALTLAMLGVLQVLMFTVLRRTEKELNPPAKFLLAAFHVLPITFATASFGSLFVFGERQVLYSGFGHAGGLLGMSLIGAGTALFVIPRATGRPIWSLRMSNVALWMMMLTFPWLGLIERVLGPLPDWVETLGISMAIASIVPALFLFTLVVNTVRGGLRDDPSVPFMTGATLIWGVAIVLNAVGSLRHPAGVLGTTWWNDAVRSAFLGAFGLWLVGLMYHLIPRIRGRALRSPALVRTHFWVGAIGVTVATLASAIAGLIQGYVLNAGAALHADVASGAGWSRVWFSIRPMLGIRVVAGGMIFAGVVLLLINVQRTLSDGSEIEIETIGARRSAEVERVGSPV
ncbi:MAG: cytochrome-c oxidase, cbb3-type subunit I [Actinomycetota bacterium]